MSDPASVRGIWEALATMSSPGAWTDAVRGAADVALELTDWERDQWAPIRDRLIAAGGERLAIDTLTSLTVAFELGALIGYGLAQTWPDRLEALDRWPRRALAYADLAAPDGAS